MATKPAKKPAAPPAVKQNTLFGTVSGVEQIVGSFDDGADDLHINAAKLRFINQSHAEGRDGNSITFRLAANDEE